MWLYPRIPYDILEGIMLSSVAEACLGIHILPSCPTLMHWNKF